MSPTLETPAISLRLRPEIEHRIQANADALGLSIEAYLMEVVESAAMGASGELLDTVRTRRGRPLCLPSPLWLTGTMAEINAALFAISERNRGRPVLSDEAISRESIYEERP